jgi:hypothetical protein
MRLAGLRCIEISLSDARAVMQKFTFYPEEKAMNQSPGWATIRSVVIVDRMGCW